MYIDCELIVKAQEATGLRPSGGIIYEPRSQGGGGACGCALGMLGLAFERINPNQYYYNFSVQALEDAISKEDQVAIATGFDMGWGASNSPFFDVDPEKAARVAIRNLEDRTDEYKRLFMESFKAACVLRKKFGKSKPTEELPEWL